MTPPDEQRRPRGSAAVIPTPASVKDTAQRTAEAGRRSGVAADGYSDGTLARWTARRERALGDRLVLNTDPELAGEQLREQLGGRALAQVWAHQLLAAL